MVREALANEIQEIVMTPRSNFWSFLLGLGMMTEIENMVMMGLTRFVYLDILIITICFPTFTSFCIDLCFVMRQDVDLICIHKKSIMLHSESASPQQR